jgi:hypothetical protein
MRRLDDIPIDPEVAASLDAIDAALAGEPVDPGQAELAELALLLAADRPRLTDARARALDERIAAGFNRRRRRRAWPVASLSLAAATAVVAVIAVALVSSRPGASVSSTSTPTPAPPHAAGGATAASAGPRALSVPAPAAKAPSPSAAGSLSSAAATGSPGLRAPGNGRKAVQSAQLQLAVAPTRIDQVAQEVFDVVGSVHGYVNNSSVTQTGGSDGYANLELTVPASALAQTMTELTRLPDARVSSRTDGIQDVTDQYGAAQRRLADAQALRTALLKQLANAQTTQEIKSLNAQLRDADGAIASAQGALNALNHQINTVQIGVTIGAAPPVPVARSSGFTIGRAARDARRVLVVAAGVALIVLAALVPLGLLAGLAWWVGAAIRRRRREQALDAT